MFTLILTMLHISRALTIHVVVSTPHFDFSYLPPFPPPAPPCFNLHHATPP